MTALVSSEDATLEELEAGIEANLHGFRTVGENLAIIRDRKLYKASHPNFELYCRERWDISKSAANRQIGQAKAAAGLPPGAPLPPQDTRKTRPERSKAQNGAGRPITPPPTSEDDQKSRATFEPEETDQPTAIIDAKSTDVIKTYELTIKPDAELGKAILKASKSARMSANDWVMLAIREKLSAAEEEAEQAKKKPTTKKGTSGSVTSNEGGKPEARVRTERTFSKDPKDCTHNFRQRDGFCPSCGDQR